MRRTLLLNGSREPMDFISLEHAMFLLVKDRVEVLDVWDDVVFQTVSRSWPAPAVVVLKRYVRRTWKSPRFRRRALFNRDGWTCQYCETPVLPRSAEVEHITPVSKGGKTSWTNCVTACRKCNKTKRNRTPEEADMRLLTVPREPHPLHFLDQASRAFWHPSWDAYLPLPRLVGR